MPRDSDPQRLWPATCHDRWMADACEPGLVSVIVPTWNRRRHLIEAMDSVCAQTYRPIELLIVDDGSTDETEQAVRDWAAGHDDDDTFRTRYVRQENRGAPVARNRGLIESRGEFIQFLDSDNLLLPQKLREDVDHLRRHCLDYVYSATELLDEHGRRYKVTGDRADRYPGGRHLTKHLWDTMGPLYTRRVCLAVGPWDESLILSQDYEYAVRVKLSGFNGNFVDEVRSQHRELGSQSVARRSGAMLARGRERAVLRIADLLDAAGIAGAAARNPIAGSLVVTARTYAASGRTGDARRCLGQARARSVGWFHGGCLLLDAVCRVVPPARALEVLRLLVRARRRLPRRRGGTRASAQAYPGSTPGASAQAVPVAADEVSA